MCSPSPPLFPMLLYSLRPPPREQRVNNMARKAVSLPPRKPHDRYNTPTPIDSRPHVGARAQKRAQSLSVRPQRRSVSSAKADVPAGPRATASAAPRPVSAGGVADRVQESSRKAEKEGLSDMALEGVRRMVEQGRDRERAARQAHVLQHETIHLPQVR